jgi:protoporphyrinogen oxidase
MFPEFDESWILDSKVWRAEFAQPVTTIGYSASVPPVETSISNVFVANMAQIYPEDRGTNFAVREGERAAKRLHAFLSSERP